MIYLIIKINNIYIYVIIKQHHLTYFRHFALNTFNFALVLPCQIYEYFQNTTLLRKFQNQSLLYIQKILEIYLYGRRLVVE